MASPRRTARRGTRRVALVTGGAVRVGRAIALGLADAGFDVVVHHGRSARAAEATATAIRRKGRRATTVGADLRQPEAAEAVVAAALAFAGERRGLDVLVCSAAAFERQPLAAITRAGWQAMLSLNAEAPLFLAQAAARALARRRGVIVNVLDVAAFHAWPGYAAYGASKAALAMITRCLALELAPRVRVAGVAPGTVLFPDAYPAADRQRVLSRVPLGRAGRPRDVAAAVRFLIESPYVTGSVLAIDGGRMAGSLDIL